MKKKKRNKYTLSEYISNGFAYLITKLFYRPARLFRRPLYLRGKKSFVIGEGLTIGHSCRFDLDGCEKTLFVGSNCEFGDNTHIVALNRVTIGDNVLIASKVFITDTNHGEYGGDNQCSPELAPNNRNLSSSSVSIGNNVWIGENVVVLPGSSIGDGCIIGANSVVKGIFGPNQIIVGAPAKIVKKYSDEINKWVRLHI